ncbi:MAG: GNAT family N-acetyltransferase [Chloroflexi bacterium]|nr:GNAT family N-acetyltransferase [Chloroflexota bacterium]
MMRQHCYSQPDDLYRAQAALTQWTREAGDCNYLHKGDVGHQLFNTCYGYDKDEVFRYWQDDAGELVAFAILAPHWEFFTLQVAPGLRGSAEHAAIFERCERETLRLAKLFNCRLKDLYVEACDCDPAYIAFVEARGYERDKHGITLTRHDLKYLPDAELPSGFRFHEATAADIDRLTELHNHTFTDKWSAATYAKVLNAPHMEREWVVVAPDGRFAAFTNLWVDHVNRSLLFEPVGAHSDFRRQGLAKALMVYALRRMQTEQGIKCAYVGHEPADKNPASGALYASVGFKPLFEIYDFKKSIGHDARSF